MNSRDQQQPQNPSDFQAENFNRRHPQRPGTSLSPEEQKVLKQCRDNAFWQRSLPLSLLMGGAVMFGVRAGKLSGSERFGHWPKTIGAATAGYFLGKITYASVCRDIFLRDAPNSEIAKAIRKSNGMPDPESSNNYSNETVVPMFEEEEEVKSKLEGSNTGMSYDMLRDQHRVRDQQKLYIPPVARQPDEDRGIAAQHQQRRPVYGEMQQFRPDPEIPPESRRQRGSSASNKYGDEGFE